MLIDETATLLRFPVTMEEIDDIDASPALLPLAYDPHGPLLIKVDEFTGPCFCNLANAPVNTPPDSYGISTNTPMILPLNSPVGMLNSSSNPIATSQPDGSEYFKENNQEPEDEMEEDGNAGENAGLDDGDIKAVSSDDEDVVDHSWDTRKLPTQDAA